MRASEEYKSMLMSLVGKLEHYPNVLTECYRELEYMSHAQQYIYAAEVMLETLKYFKEKNGTSSD